MHKSADVTRRFALKAGVGSVLALGLTPGTLLAQSDEDPAEIILRIAGDAFNLFGSLNGRSRDWLGAAGEGRAFLDQATEVKTVWVPYGE